MRKCAVVILSAVMTLYVFTVCVYGAERVHGFFEGAYGLKLGDERGEKNSYNMLEGRLQARYTYNPALMEDWDPELFLKGYLLADDYREAVDGKIRELNISFTPLAYVDAKMGRQILTWGTGDLLFVNDLFPKDYVSFFIGRDDEYLKLPSDAVKVSVFLEDTALDIVAIPFFKPNNTIRGDRLSYYDILLGGIEGKKSDHTFSKPPATFKNIEIASRLYRTFGAMEASLYAFKGFYKQPMGIRDAAGGEFYFPGLNVYGFSVRGPLSRGVGGVEVGLYDSSEDRGGRDRLVENSAIKYLAGYTMDLGDNLSIGLQYMLEEMLHYDSYRTGLLEGDFIRDEFRHLMTVRLAKLSMNQTVESGLFVFYSPTDRDIYMRPSVSYSATDDLRVTLGANIFSGRYDYTEFGQMEGNNNIYTRVRYNF